jgi:predicted Zn-dependent protease
MFLKFLLAALILTPFSLYAQCKIKNSTQVDRQYESILRSICNTLANDERVVNKKFVLGITDKFKNPNAFAVKDGGTQFIFINPAMLDLHSKNKYSISFVIAHEISHFSLGHVQDLNDSDLKGRLINSSLTTLSTAFGATFSGLMDLLAATTTAQYSQKQELDADKFALSLLVNNGYSKEYALYSMGIIKDISTTSSFNDFLKTHPNPSLRLQKIQSIK